MISENKDVKDRLETQGVGANNLGGCRQQKCKGYWWKKSSQLKYKIWFYVLY